jgi:Ca-activated chloride channel family protein
MMRRAAVLVAAACAATLLTGPAPEARQAGQAPQDKPQVFRAGVEVVSLNVTVTDPQGRYITDVGQDEFSVFEDGAKQELTYFNRTNLPIALSLLIDSSASMEQRMTNAQDAAIGFARKLRPQDLAQVVDFDSRVEIKLGFTNKVEELETAIHATSPGGSTALHNAVYIALKELAKIKARNPDEVRRQAIVVLETSALKGFREAEFVLRQLAQETGGRAFFARQIDELKDVYGQIADELSSQYSMGYASKNPRRDGAFRRIVVQVARPNTLARTKRGYYGPVSH